MTTLQYGDTATYDAWDRLAKVVSNSTIIQRNVYDGTNRRIQIFSNYTDGVPGTVEDDYLSGQQVIETRENAAVKYQQIWSPRYIDAAILRDTYSGGSIVQAARVFYLSDANYNVTGLVKYDSQSETWGVAERYTYTPYGVVTYRNADWTTATSSANLNTTLYTGRTLELLTAIYYYRGRYYDPLLERFITTDPIRYRGGINLYEYVGDDPTTCVDPSGLWKIERANGPTAVATSEKGDTIGILSSTIGLHATKFPQWLTTPKSVSYEESGRILSVGDTVFNTVLGKWINAKLCADQKFEIPNRIMCLWYGDMGGDRAKLRPLTRM